MADPILERDLALAPLAQVIQSAGPYLSSLPDRPVFDNLAQAALRPALTNWRTTAADLELLVAVVREIAARLRFAVSRRAAAGPGVPDSAVAS